MRTALALIASFLLVGAASLPARAQWSNYGYNGDIVRCESRDGRVARCNAYGDAQLVRQLSDSACIRNRTWGTDRQGLWVSGGCRAEFRVQAGYGDAYYGNDYGYGSDYGYGDYGYGNNYGYGNDGVFRCESRDSRTTHCNSYGTARLVRQLSDSPCIRGRTWGADARGVWVSGGCRAIFQSSGYAGGYYGGYGNGVVRCESRDNRSRTCNINTGRRGDVRLIRQLSDTPCIEGRTWGQSGNRIWVTRGCRAEFIVTRDRGRGNDGGWLRPPGDLGDERPPGASIDHRRDAGRPAAQRTWSQAPGMPGGERRTPPQVEVADRPPPGQVEQTRERSRRPVSQPVQIARTTEQPGGAAAGSPGQEDARAGAPAARQPHPRLRERQARTDEQAGEPGQVTP